MRQRDLTFFILSFIDDSVQLPITQPAPVDQSHPTISSSCSNLPLPSDSSLPVVKSSSSLPPALLSSPCPPLFALLRGPAKAQALKSEKTSLGVPCWLPVISFWHRKQIKKIALIHARAILIDSTHLYEIQRLLLSPKQSSTNTRPSQTNSSITMSVSSYRSILLISSSLALFPPLSLSTPSLLLFHSHVAPAFKWLHEEF